MKYTAFSLALLLAAVDARTNPTASPIDFVSTDTPTTSPVTASPTPPSTPKPPPIITDRPTPPPTPRPVQPPTPPPAYPTPAPKPTPPPTQSPVIASPTPPPTLKPTSKASKSKSAKSKSKKVGLFAKTGKVLSKQAEEAVDGRDYLLMTEAGGDDPSMSMGKDASSMSMMKFVGLRPTPSPADRGPIFGDSSVAMISSGSDDSSSESD